MHTDNAWIQEMRKCRNWQTSKTKDLVSIALVWVQVPSSAQLKMKMTQISSGSFFILEPADEFLETQWFQGLACRLGRLAACRPLDDARPIFRKSFRGLREIKKRVRMNACIQDELFFVFISKTRSCDERSTECVANPVIRCYITCTP